MTIAQCYKSLQNILKVDIEPFQTVLCVEEHRNFWKPTEVNVILLAESHVFTTLQEVHMNNCNSRYIPDPNYPKEYCRFVYCLSYGENGLLNQPIQDNSGTAQFWKLLYSCTENVADSTCFSPILKRYTPNLEERISNKYNLLQNLREMGVWLVDASICALYRPGGKTPNPKLKASAITTCWNNIIRDRILDCKPKHVICIGMGVSKTIGYQLSAIIGDNLTVVPQPQARFPQANHQETYSKCYQICKNFT